MQHANKGHCCRRPLDGDHAILIRIYHFDYRRFNIRECSCTRGFPPIQRQHVASNQSTDQFGSRAQCTERNDSHWVTHEHPTSPYILEALFAFPRRASNRRWNSHKAPSNYRSCHSTERDLSEALLTTPRNRENQA